MITLQKCKQIFFRNKKVISNQKNNRKNKKYQSKQTMLNKDIKKKIMIIKLIVKINSMAEQKIFTTSIFNYIKEFFIRKITCCKTFI